MTNRGPFRNDSVSVVRAGDALRVSLMCGRRASPMAPIR